MRIFGTGFTASAVLTRTADTNAYTANDVLGAATGSTAALTFDNIGPSSANVMITSAELLIEDTGVISGETSYVLHLYNKTPPSALGDNAAFDVPSGDRSSYLGSINLGTPVDLGSTLYVRQDSLNMHIRAAGTAVYGYLVTAGGYTPTSARVYNIKLRSIGL